MATKWVTRESVRVDRVSSSWLILSFVDPDA
ncbi:MAG TPA: chromate resistance protein, partial [Chloroflexi bacterium]|nr:chromate resistance protein [Chloroflexota bacterium]